MKRYLLLSILIVILVMAPIQASYVTVAEVDESANVTTQIQIEKPVTPYRIEQGQCVELNDTIDMAGVGWYTGSIAYYGRWYDGYGALSNGSVEAIYKIDARDLKRFYIDPTFFGNNLGWWYNFYDESDSHGYDRLFYVAERCVLTKEQNASIVSKAFNESERIQGILRNKTTLPVKTIDGRTFIISRGIDTLLSAEPGSSRWLFGTDNQTSMYDVPVDKFNITYFNAADTWDMPAGTYDAFFVSPGRNGIIEENYDKQRDIITSPFRAQPDVYVRGIDGKSIEKHLLERIGESYDDTYDYWKIELQDPLIEVKRLDTTPLKNNFSYVTIAGYTNANAGNKFKLQMDLEKNGNRARTYDITVTDNGGMRAYRTYNVSFILDLNSENPGMHYFTITALDTGATITAPFYVYRELPAHYQQESYLQYVGYSPFIPTPTPEIIIKKEIQKVVEKVTVTVPVPPSQESVDTAFWNGMVALITLISQAALVCIVIGYLAVSYIRGRKEQ